MAEVKLRKELLDLTQNPPIFGSAGPVSPTNMFKWDATIFGPLNSPYEGGVFKLTIQFDEEYPYKPPKVVFKTQVYHPNIYSNGSIKLDILEKKHWSPVFSIYKLLLSIHTLLIVPNLDDPAVPEIAHTYRTNKTKYDADARKSTRKHAIPR